MLGKKANARPAPALSSRATLWSGHCLHLVSQAPTPGGCCSLTHTAANGPAPWLLPSWIRSRTRNPGACTHAEAGRKSPEGWSSAEVWDTPAGFRHLEEPAMPGDTLHTQTAPTATGPGTLGLSPLHSGPIAMGNGSHPRDEHASTDRAQEGHGRLLLSGGGPNMEVILEARRVQSQGLMCSYHSVGSRACSSLWVES